MIKLNPLTGNFDDVGFPARTITGTTNQVTVTNGDGVSGNPTLSLPQDIHTTATPTLGGATLTNTSGDLLTLNGTSTGNAVIRFQDDGVQTGAIFSLDGTTTLNIRSQAVLQLISSNATTPRQINFSSTAFNSTVDSIIELGTNSNYWSNTYTDRLYLNSTAYIDGGTAGTALISGLLRADNIQTQSVRSNDATSLVRFSGGPANNGAVIVLTGSTHTYTGTGLLRKDTTEIAGWSANGVHIGSDATKTATHSLTLQANATGIALYNTADQTTNFERVRMAYISNEFRIGGTFGGSGNIRPINISAFDSTTVGLRLNASSTSGVVQSTLTTGSAGSITSLINGTLSSSSGIQYPQVITPTINQSSTAGYTALLINPTETATGSGTKLLADFQVGGTSKVSIKNDGVIFPVQAATASAPTYVKGGIYYDTTLNKLRVGGATAWETCTSV